MELKYELVHNQPKKFTNGAKKPVDVFPIRAVRDIPSLGIKAGDVGGDIQSDENLSHFADSWVFKGSTVSHGGRVTDNAIVMGDSTITDNAMVSGRCRIEHSKIQEGSLVSGKAVVKYATVSGKSSINETFLITDSEVHGIHASKGSISMSRVQSKGGRLTLTEEVVIKQCTLEILDDEPVITSRATLKQVTAREMLFFRIWEQATLTNVAFDNQTELYIGTENSENGLKTTIEGESGYSVIRFDGVTLDISDTTITGNVAVKGDVHLIGCTLREFASIENHTDANLKLKAVSLWELASIIKEPHLSGDTIIEHQKLWADSQVFC